MNGWHHLTKGSPCPICGHDDGCEISTDGALVTCRRMDAGAFKTLNNGAGWLHRLNGRPISSPTTHLPRLIVERPSVVPQKAPPAILDAVYTALLAHLDLSPEHRAHLTGPQRQLSIAQIRRRGYRSLPARGRSAIVRELIRRFGADRLHSVPGFYMSDRGRGPGYITIAGPSGLLIPFRDVEGRIVGLQIRPDGQMEDGPKYIWMSSKGRPGGIGPGGDAGLPAHVSRPLNLTGNRVWITEGPLKADIASDILGEIVIAVAGVGTWEGSHVLEILYALNAKETVDGYDADFVTNGRVREARQSLCIALAVAGFTVHVALWNECDGKGIDDLLLNRCQPRLESWSYSGTARVVKVPAAAVGSLRTASAVPIGVARDGHFREMSDAISKAQPGRMIIVSSGTGTGKTAATIAAMERLWHVWPIVTGKRRRNGKFMNETGSVRVLFATDTREQIERILVDYPWLSTCRTWGEVAVRVGRDAVSCCDSMLDRVNAYGSSRHSVAINVCDGCELRDAPCRYWQSVADADEARIVLATKDSLFYGGEELSTFEVVVVDEDLTRCLFEGDVTLDLARLVEWTRQMNRIRGLDPDAYTDTHPHRRLVSLLSDAIMQAPVDGPVPLLPELRRIAGGAEALADLVRMAAQIRPSDKTGRFTFEEPSAGLVPLRLMDDLQRLLSEEEDRPEGADTRLWVSREGIKPCLFRTDVADVLRGRTLINLDATPSPVIHHIFPNAEIIRYDVPEDIEIVQITDALFTRRTLERPGARDRLNAALEAITKEAENPVIFCRKSWNPEADGNERKETLFQVSNPNTVWGHYGAHNRALNISSMMDADVLVIVGFYCHPPSHQRALAQAVRNSAVPVARSGQAQALKAYAHVGKDGRGVARRVRSDPDPLVQEMIDSQIAADVIQAIGRARACLRTGGRALRVFVLTGYPIPGLRVDRLTTLAEFVGADAGKWPPQEPNRRRAEETRLCVEKIVREMKAEGLPVSLRSVRARAGGGSLKTIQKILSGGDTGRSHKYMEDLRNPARITPRKDSKNELQDIVTPDFVGTCDDMHSGNGKTVSPGVFPVADDPEATEDELLEVRV